MDTARFLIGDADGGSRAALADLLSQAGISTDAAASGEEVLERTRQAVFDVLLLDARLPAPEGGSLLRAAKSVRPSMMVVALAEAASVEDVLHSFRDGAFDVLRKPVERAALLELASRADNVRAMGEKRRRIATDLERERARADRLAEQLERSDPFMHIVGRSAAMGQLLETIREVARTDSTVLLTGESGTGKGLVARAIHEASTRAAGPFVEANCVVYSEGVLHSELFGHERGAFTGADRTKKGRFEVARGGTLFLDEIGDITPATQLLLLRVLQDRSFERVGGEETLEADVRLIAATNRDLEESMRQGAFRADLFYRLNVIPVHLLPLRERAEDIAELAQHFLQLCASRLGRTIEGFGPEALAALTRYRWPGNVRELENTIERLVVLNRSGLIEAAELPPAVRQELASAPAADRPGTLEALERDRILQVLAETAGNKKRAARTLGIHRSTLYAKLRRYGLEEPRPANGHGQPRA